MFVVPALVLGGLPGDSDKDRITKLVEDAVLQPPSEGAGRGASLEPKLKGRQPEGVTYRNRTVTPG